MNPLKTNNLPGYGFSQKVHQPVLWHKMFTNHKIYLYRINANKYHLFFSDKNDISQKYRHIKIKKGPLEYPLIIQRRAVNNKQTIIPVGINPGYINATATATTSSSSEAASSSMSTSLDDLVEIPDVITSSTSSSSSAASSTASATASVTAPITFPFITPSLVTYNDGSICIGCDTFGLVEYIVIFPGSTPLYTGDDLFIIDGVDLLFN